MTITTKFKTRFCFAWCCTDLNRPWPPTAESQVQENHFEICFRKYEIKRATIIEVPGADGEGHAKREDGGHGDD